MNLQEFRASLTGKTPPPGLDLALQAMWYEATGDWDKAHSLAQQKDDRTGAWVHAYLHRQEGDQWNANYWYSRAGRSMPDQSLEQEWEDITTALLEQG
jgi:hypothetical protein